MANNIAYEIANMLRERTVPENYYREFIIIYYLNRKLKTNSFDRILNKFEDKNIRLSLKAVYEDVNNYIEYFNNFKDFTLDEVIEIISELSEHAGRRSGSENTTVKSVVDLSLELLDLEKEDKLLDVGSGIGITLLEASKKSDISGIEIDPENYMLSCILLDLFDLPFENIKQRDVLSYDLSKFNANKVFMNMPMNMKMSGEKLEYVLELKFDKSVYKNHIRSADSSLVFALDIIENTEYEKFAMLINGSPLYSDIHQDIRKILINKGKVDTVIALPGNLLAYTAIPIYLVVFSHDNESIKFVDATNLYSVDKYRNKIEQKHIDEILSALEKDSYISKTVGIKKLEKEDFTLDPLRYTTPAFPFEESLTLKDVVKSINRGHTIGKSDLDRMTSVQPTNYQYLMLQNFQDGILDENLPYLKNLDKTYDKYLLKDNSIIISRLSPFKIGSVDRLKTKVLANGNLFFLEIDEEKIDKDFLTAYLQSRVGLREIEKYVKGTTMKTINLRDLEKVKIPKISMEKQIEIGKKFVLLNSEFKVIKKRAEEIARERMNIFEGGI
ncbi:MAG: N-6 DNA methylase [Ruminococcaceae bacterium]|nr:N-6 DNA methylase [Oscillospiraceae bacterium]